MARCRGFTTVELVITIVILGILSGVAVPALAKISSLRHGAGLSVLVQDLRYAQSLAMSDQLRTWVVFDVSANSYSMFIEPSAGAGRSGRVPLEDPLTHDDLLRDLDELSVGALTLSSVNISGGVELEFDASGTPYDASESKLTTDAMLLFSDGTSITIYSQTGFAQLVP